MDSQVVWLELCKILGAGSVGFTAAILAEPVRQWLFAPKLELTFSPLNTAEYPSVSPEGNPFLDQSGKQRFTKNAIVHVRNTASLRTAKNCRVYLHMIEYKEEANHQFQVRHKENLPLNWAYSDDKPRDIPGKIGHNCDIFFLISGSDVVTHRANAPYFAWGNIVGKPGHYRFTILAVADNTKPQQLSFTFHWRGKYSDVSTSDFVLG